MTQDARPLRILIVEDEWMIADDARIALTKAGCSVVGVAGTVEQALSLMRETAFDAAVIDANLDGTSAEPVARALKGRAIPFLVVSGYASGQRQGALAEAPFLTKPYDEAQLASLVRGLAGGPG